MFTLDLFYLCYAHGTICDDDVQIKCVNKMHLLWHDEVGLVVWCFPQSTIRYNNHMLLLVSGWSNLLF